MKQLKLFSLIIIFLISITLVNSHGNILYDIDLDFDKELEDNVIKAAHDFLGIDEDPLEFDFDKELIIVKFDRKLQYSVAVNPIDYSVFGFRDDNLLKRGADVVFDEKQRKEIAEEIFNSIPKAYAEDLVYTGEEKLYSGSFRHTWHRFIEGVYVSGEFLEVEIDGSSGEVIAWKLTIFFHPKNEITINPAISYRVAQKIAEIRFDAEEIDVKPFLMIDRDKPVWVAKVKGLYPFFVAIDALDGNVIYSGSLRDEVPNDYDFGRDVEVIETDLIKEIYGNQ